jgi:hypothetical protein
MQKFVAQQNLLHFRLQLEEELDSGRRKMLLDLIAEEEAKLDAVLAAEEQQSQCSANPS